MTKQNVINNFKNDQDGSTAVEFALIAVIFLTVLFGIVEAGRMFWAQNAIQYAIEVASRDLLVDSSLSEGEVEDSAAAALEGMLISSAPFSVEINIFSVDSVEYVEIDATYRYTPIINIFLPESWSTLDLEAHARRPLVWN